MGSGAESSVVDGGVLGSGVCWLLPGFIPCSELFQLIQQDQPSILRQQVHQLSLQRTHV